MKAAGAEVAGGAAAGAARMRAMNATGAPARAPSFATAPRRSPIETCYRVVLDTAWARGLPEQFALVRDSVSGANVVRALSAGGRMDSVIPGARWGPTVANGATIQLPSAAKTFVTIQVTSNTDRARAFVSGETHEVKLDRLDCRP